MPMYDVTVTRTELITFTLQADNENDAEERYLMDGDETAAETVDMTVDSVSLA